MIHEHFPFQRYEIATVPHGSKLQPPAAPDGWRLLPKTENKKEFIEITKHHVVLDVGNALEPGVLDHHQFRSSTSATQLVFENPRLILDWVDRSAEKITLVVHNNPDIDCMAAVFLTVHLLENGALNPAWKPLVDHVTHHDQGYVVPYEPYKLTPYFYFQFLWEYADETFGKDKSDPEWKIKTFNGFIDLSFQLFAEVVQSLEQKPFDYKLLESVPDKSPFSEIKKQIHEDSMNYRILMDDVSRVRLFDVWVQQQGSRRPCRVDGLRVIDPEGVDHQKNNSENQKPKVKMIKVWARMDTQRSPRGKGFIFTWVTYPVDPEKSKIQPIESAQRARENPKFFLRHVLSVEPNSGLNLRGLGKWLNRMERQRRQELVDQDKKDVSLLIASGENERWPNVGLSDPWYDGRGHDDTIVDTPRAGTVLTEKEIESALQNFTVEDSLYNTRLNRASCDLVFSFSPPPVPASSDTPHGAFIEKLKNAGFKLVAPDEPAFWGPASEASGKARPKLDPAQHWGPALKEMFASDYKSLRSRPFCMLKKDPFRILLHASGSGLLSIHLDFRFPGGEKPRCHDFESSQNATQKLLDFNRELVPGNGFNLDSLNEFTRKTEEILQMANLKGQELLEILKKLGISEVVMEAPHWNLLFASLHESRHAGFANKLFAAFATHVSKLDHVQHADERELRQAQRIGDGGRMLAGRGGLFLFLNDPDPQLDDQEIQEHTDIFQCMGVTVRYHTLVHSLWRHMETELVQLMQQPEITLSRLHALRHRALQMDAQLVPSAQSPQALVDLLEHRFLAQLGHHELRNRLLEDLDDLDEYLTSRQEMLFQRRIAYISLLILPLTLLADYLGALLFSWKPYGIFFPVALIVTVLLLLLTYKTIEIKTRMD